MSGSLFLDTGALVGVIVRRDRYHAAARELFSLLQAGTWTNAYTSDHVIAEALNYLRARAPHPDYVTELLDLLFGRPGLSPAVRDVLRVHSGRFAESLERFRTRFDQGLSFTDWTNVVLMEEMEISTVATTDSGFEGLVHEVHLLEPP